MKKLAFMFMATVFLTAHVIAQETSVDLREEATFGFKIGVNYSNVYDAQDESFVADPKLGFATGIFASVPIGKFIGVQPELLFSQRGYKSTGSILGFDYETTRTSSYIDVPLLLAIKPAPSFTILAGPQFSFLVKQKDVLKTPNATVEDELEIDNDNVRKNTLCFTGGFDINLNQLVIGARAGWDLRENKGDGTNAVPRYKNMWYQATIGFRF
jgi:hypothetical protein